MTAVLDFRMNVIKIIQVNSTTHWHMQLSLLRQKKTDGRDRILTFHQIVLMLDVKSDTLE